MGLATIIARRSLLQRPGRTLFSILGIAVGIATVVGVFTLDHNTLIMRSHEGDADWRAEIEVSPSAAVQKPREELARVAGVSDVTAAFQAQASLWTGETEGAAPARVQLLAIEPEHAAKLASYFLLSGRDIADDASEPEVLIGERLADEKQLAVGALISLSAPRRAPSKDCVDGEWITRENRVEAPRPRDFRVVGVLGREGVGRRARGEVVMIDYDVGRELYAGTQVETRFWLKKDPAINLETLQTNLGEAWSYDLKKSVIIGQASDERAFRNGVRFAGLLALVLGLFVIFHTLSMSLLERVREVGVLHALGTTRAQIGRVFLTEAAVIAGAGGALGLAGGVGLALFLLYKRVTTVGIGLGLTNQQIAEYFDVPWPVVAPLVALGVVIALAGSIYPLAKARNTDAVSALRGQEAGQAHGVGRGFHVLAALLLVLVVPAVYFGVVPVIGAQQSELVGVLMLGLAVLALFVAVPLVAPALISFVCVRLAKPFELVAPLAGKLSARAMQRGPARIAGAVAGIALVTAGYVGLRGMTRSLEAEIDVWSREALLDKVYARNLPPTRVDDIVEKLHLHPEVLGVEPDEARTYSPFLLIGVRASELTQYGPLAENAALQASFADGRSVIVSRRLAKEQDYEVGDPVHVQTPSGRVETFNVLAISDAYGYFSHPDERIYGVVSERWMRELFCIDTEVTDSIGVRFAAGTSVEDAENIVRTALDVQPNRGTIETGAYLHAWIASDIARDFVLFDIIIALTVVLAGLGVLNGQLLSALERSRELGVLKALGMSRGQVAGHVLLESAVVGALGGVLGALLGCVVVPVIVKALQVISGLPLPAESPGIHAVYGALGAVVVAVLAGLYPIWRMNRADAIAAVRTGV